MWVLALAWVLGQVPIYHWLRGWLVAVERVIARFVHGAVGLDNGAGTETLVALHEGKLEEEGVALSF